MWFPPIERGMKDCRDLVCRKKRECPRLNVQGRDPLRGRVRDATGCSILYPVDRNHTDQALSDLPVQQDSRGRKRNARLSMVKPP